MDSTSEGDADKQILKFLVEKSKNLTAPWTVASLAEDYQKTGSTLTSALFYYRIEKLRRKVQDLEDLDIETRVKLMFGLGAPLDRILLNRLSQQPGVKIEVDEQDRIVKYEKQGGLRLQGKHKGKRSREVSDRDKPILVYLAEKVKSVSGTLLDSNIIRDYKMHSNDIRSTKSLLERFRYLKTCIYGSTEFDQNTRIRMLFCCGTSISDRLLEELHSMANVELDLERRIVRYSAHDGSLELEGDHKMKNKLKSAQEERKRRSEGGEMEYQEVDEDLEEYTPRKRAFAPSTSGHSSFVEYETMDSVSHSPYSVKMEPIHEEESEDYSPWSNTRPADLPSIKNRTTFMPKPQNNTELAASQILDFLRSLICTLDISLLSELQLKIEQTIEAIEDKMVPIDDVLMILQSSFIIAKSNASSPNPMKDSTSFILFLTVFRCSLFTLKSACFEPLHERIRSAIKGTENQNKRIENEKIKTVIESVLALVV